MLDPRTITAYRARTWLYPKDPPFHPHERYPEYELRSTSGVRNEAYEAVRECLRLAGLDRSRFGTGAWNPFGGLILPGNTVLLKPNLIKERHPSDERGWEYLVTNGSIVRAIADYVWRALEGRGRVIVADAPHTDASFQEICRIVGLGELRSFYRGHGLDFDIYDLRKEEWTTKNDVTIAKQELPGDPRGYVAVDLEGASELAGHGGSGRYYGADYDYGEVNRHHSEGRHEYLVARSAIDCDVLFNLPKLKTHKKTGLTASLKNLVGINGDKNWLPHHTEGDPSNGGDEHPRRGLVHDLERRLVRGMYRWLVKAPGITPGIYRKLRPLGLAAFGHTEDVIRSGNWAGNDTAWRMCLDLNKILLYGSSQGGLRSSVPQHRKRILIMVDALLAGEGRGPMNPHRVDAGLILFGVNPASVDAACAYLMGFDPEKIPIVRQAFRCRAYPIADWEWSDVRIVSNVPEWNTCLPEIPEESTLHFEPHFGWKGAIERDTGRGAGR